MCPLAQLFQNSMCRFMLLHHHENRVAELTETDMCCGIGKSRVVFHMSDEWKQYFLFFSDVREHIALELPNQQTDLIQFRRVLAFGFGQRLRHLDKRWEVMSYPMVMSANYMLNQLRESQTYWVNLRLTAFSPLQLCKFLQHLFDRQLEIVAGFLERLVGFRAGVNSKSFEDLQR